MPLDPRVVSLMLACAPAAASLAAPTLAPIAQSRSVRATASAGADDDTDETIAPDFATFTAAADASASSATVASFSAAGQSSTIGLAAVEAGGNASSSASRGAPSAETAHAVGESKLSVTFEILEPAMCSVFARVEAARALPGSDVMAEIRLTGDSGDLDLRRARLEPFGPPDLIAVEERGDALVIQPGVYTLTALARAGTSASPEKSAAAVFQVTVSLGPAPVCPGDLNGDGVVDAADIAQVLSRWNSPYRATDFTGDGITNAQDLSIVLGVWGPCEPR